MANEKTMYGLDVLQFRFRRDGWVRLQFYGLDEQPVTSEQIEYVIKHLELMKDAFPTVAKDETAGSD